MTPKLALTMARDLLYGYSILAALWSVIPDAEPYTDPAYAALRTSTERLYPGVPIYSDLLTYSHAVRIYNDAISHT